ncbi:deleted in lung and esophageal cancer protein 1 isoform X1 [Chiloscyllium plagiosum]|uniref:deleted in lung and esophageal cancer protein 1 isoform X1 n=1 Tax=Chiloscyllium plagiosum TaxID=36176 RepID=UPI001CB7F913|nr:deleted in lung and esophageal cancer protein 1 isoform X1 [Chiloscyllium plagiosum]XP_043546786.1 deleted in lung and esophageal cancer protein 1 isoform X1 [Chiloscyllium plagiosum]
MLEEETVEKIGSNSVESEISLLQTPTPQNSISELTKDVCEPYENENDQATSSEPFMYRHRPTSGRTQDISFLLASIFKDLYTGGVIGEDIIKNLLRSRGGDDEYHEQFVQQLQEIHAEYDKRIAEADAVEKHIIQARARATAAEEKALNKEKESGIDFKSLDNKSLGLPTVKSTFRDCIDSEFLKTHNLIVPEDYITEKRTSSKAPIPAAKPQTYVPKLTKTFKKRISKSPVDDGYTDMSQPKGPCGLLECKSSLTLLSSSEESIVPKVSKSQEEKSNKYLWRDQLPVADRIQAREVMTKFEKCHNFLKNPRHLPPQEGGKSLIIPKKKVPKKVAGRHIFVDKSDPNEPIPVFLANPPIILFTNYKVGQVYETNVELRNLTSSSRHLRVIPPSTSFFSIGLGKFPGEGGIVAPGMSCQYTVRFAPDSPAEYEDFLLVETQTPYPLVVPIEARRSPPILTLPGTLDCGYCLVGGVKITEFLCRNDGYNSGCFCVMPKKMWPTTNFRSVAAAGFLDVAPFAIRPAVFELSPGQTLIMEVAFLPPSSDTFSQTVTMVCDNCHVKDFVLRGSGQYVASEFISISGGESITAPGECRDVTADHFVRFDATNPCVCSQKTLTLRNATHVELPFCWQVLKPNLVCPIPGESVVPTNLDYDQDLKSAFHISPDNGVLAPHQDHEFILAYFPRELKEYHNVFYLVLRDVPEPLNANECNTSRKSSLERSMKTASAAMTNIVGMELEVKGYTEPFQVLLRPYAILIPGENYLGTTLKKYFEMWNYSKSTIYYEWESMHDSHILEVLPPCGAIEPNDFCDLELLLTGGKVEKIKHRLPCHIRYQEEPVVLYIEAAFMGAQVCIDLPSLDFCLMRLGTSAMCTIQIKNTCQLSALWHLQESPECLKERNEEVSQFAFEPSSGELLPLAEHNVTILFTPTKCQSLKTVLELKVENGNTSHIAVKAEVQAVQVCLLSSTVIFKDIYVGIPAQETVKIFNQTLLPTKYTWGELHESEAHQYRVTVSAASYTLGPNEEVTACVELTAYSMRELSGLILSCMVEEMKEPLLLEIFAKPKGLNVTYSIPADSNEESNSLLLNFSEVMVHGTMKRQLLITNNTAIPAAFNLEVDYFSSCSPVPPSVSRLAVSQSSSQSRTPLLKRTVSLTEGPSKSQNQLQREFEDVLLCHRKGAAFVVQPKTGTLEPYQQLTIEITAFANMWGDYSDYLICRVGDLEPTCVPMQLSVKGIPLYFKVLGPQKDNQMQGPVVRFGTHIAGGDTVSRSLRLFNRGPYDIRLDWETYNHVKDDLQLVDLIISYGQQFPLKDESGTEIMGISIAPSESAHSYDWDAIPNSLESSSSALQTTECELEEEEEVPEEAEKESKPASPLISVVLRAHEGIAADYPYYVTPRQVVVPAGSFVTINVSFTPLTQTEVTTNVECEGFAFGYLSLDDQLAFGVPGKVTRCQGYDKEALRLDFKAVVKPALLRVEMDDDDEGLSFYAAASDLIPDGLEGEIQKEILTTRGFKLTNSTETPLYFQFLLKRPFCILNVDPKNSLKSSNSDREENAKMLVLYPQQCTHVTIAFCTSLDLLKSQEYWSPRRKRKLEFKQDLVIEYNNKTTQLIPLHAFFDLPFLELSTDSVNFGICLVGQCRRKEIFLLNRTGSKSFWSATIAPVESQEDQGVFEICPELGVLQAHSIYLSTSRTAIQITFKARDEKMYHTNIVIQGILGEKPVKFSVQGRGTLDEKYEAMFVS